MMRMTFGVVTALCLLGNVHAVAALAIDLDNAAGIANGEKRFAQNCAYCHGSAGIGGKQKNLQCRDFDPDYLFDTISSGLQSGSFFMPPYDDAFSEEQRWELVAYIDSLGRLDSCAE